MKIGSIISYCTHDYRFLGKCIEEVKKFSHQVLIPVCDHFYDGTPENRSLLETTYAEHPDCQFIEFSYDAERLYTPYLSFSKSDREWACLWHSTARYIGFLHLAPEIDYVLFLDCDEILEGNLFAKWLETGESEKWNAVRVCGYYYIMRSTLRATILQQLALFAKKRSFRSFHFIQPGERYALFQSIGEPKTLSLLGQKPLIHHYSWVRTFEENMHKAQSWGHQKDQNWQEIVSRSFAGKEIQQFFGADFEFEEIQKPYFDPLSIQVPWEEPSNASFRQVKKVDHRTILQMELDSL